MSKRHHYHGSSRLPQREDEETELGKTQRKRAKRSSFVSDHKGEVQDLVQKGLHPFQIADTLVAQHNLPPKSVTAKQISDWIGKQKKKGKIKTKPVTEESVEANWNDSCESELNTTNSIRER